MYAIVEIAGKQYKVTEGRYLDVDKLDHADGEQITLDQVLLLASDSTAPQIGQPLVQGASVSATVLKSDKDAKIIVYKMKRKKGYRRKQGHRQAFTRIQIDKISG